MTVTEPGGDSTGAVEWAVRQAVPAHSDADLEAVTELRLSWAASRGTTPDREALRSEIAQWLIRQGPDRVWWLAECQRDPIGMANAWRYERMPLLPGAVGGWAYVGQVWVEPAWRRRGVASALMRSIESWARAEGLSRIVLNPSEMSIPMYRSVGYDSTGLLQLDLS